MTVAIEIDTVSKRFRLYQEQVQSLKERVIKGRIAHEDFWALRDVSFEVKEGETVGLLGHNGSGKSTLLKCVAGILRPTSGRIVASGRMASLLELGAGFHPELTGRENVYLNGSILGLSKAEISRVFDDIVAFAEIEPFIDNQVKHFSSGMYARLGFAVAVNVDPDVLVIDEVLSVGDEAFQRKCINRIKAFQAEGRTILFVTHAADTVRQICDRAVVLDHGKMVIDAEPGLAVRAYRETLLQRDDVPAEADPQAGADEPDAERRRTLKIRITEVQIDYPQPGRRHLLPGEALAVRVRYQAAEAIDEAVFGVAVYDVKGDHVFGTNTELLELAVAVPAGGGEVAFCFDSVPLLDGTFFLTIGIHHPGGDPIFDWREQRHSFEVVNPGRTDGLVDLGARVEVRGATATPLTMG
jgi:ABC-2 type transport system ATP-binding protein